jgi:hypothetical protein
VCLVTTLTFFFPTWNDTSFSCFAPEGIAGSTNSPNLVLNYASNDIPGASKVTSSAFFIYNTPVIHNASVDWNADPPTVFLKGVGLSRFSALNK